MAAVTEPYSVLFGDRPFVRLMTIEALEILFLHMEAVLSDIDFT